MIWAEKELIVYLSNTGMPNWVCRAFSCSLFNRSTDTNTALALLTDCSLSFNCVISFLPNKLFAIWPLIPNISWKKRRMSQQQPFFFLNCALEYLTLTGTLTLVPKERSITYHSKVMANVKFFCRHTDKHTGQKLYAPYLSRQGHKIITSGVFKANMYRIWDYRLEILKINSGFTWTSKTDNFNSSSTKKFQ